MDVTQTNAAAASARSALAATTAQGKTGLDYDAFLQLLIAQMKNQDPLNPVDSTQYVSQLASFSSVEQAIKTNAKLDGLLAAQALGQAEGLIGRTVTSADGQTAGRVRSLQIVSGGLIATLDTGQTLPLGAGITIA